MAEDNSDKGFSVVDRRIETEEETSKQEQKSDQAAEQREPASEKGSEESSKETGTQASAPSEQKEEKGEQPSTPGQTESQPPPANFPSFLLSLHSAALIHLGLVPNPADNQVNVDLPLARYHIDLLEMLEKKTRGNLDEEEDKLIKNILYELRMAFLDVSKKQ